MSMRRIKHASWLSWVVTVLEVQLPPHCATPLTCLGPLWADHLITHERVREPLRHTALALEHTAQQLCADEGPRWTVFLPPYDRCTGQPVELVS